MLHCSGWQQVRATHGGKNGSSYGSSGACLDNIRRSREAFKTLPAVILIVAVELIVYIHLRLQPSSTQPAVDNKGARRTQHCGPPHSLGATGVHDRTGAFIVFFAVIVTRTGNPLPTCEMVILSNVALDTAGVPAKSPALSYRTCAAAKVLLSHGLTGQQMNYQCEEHERDESR